MIGVCVHVFIADETAVVQSDSMECVDNSVERISNDLVTFSLLPASRWKNLLNLDVIRVIVYLLIFAKICENVFQFLFQIK